MTAAPQDLELNVPEIEAKVVAGSEVNLFNWRNWLAFVIAVALVAIAAKYSFMSINDRNSLLNSIKGFLR